MRGDQTDLTGKTINRWHVLKRVPRPPYTAGKGAWYLCECECGKQAVIPANNLRSGMSKSCGCIRVEKLMDMHERHRLGKSKNEAPIMPHCGEPEKALAARTTLADLGLSPRSYGCLYRAGKRTAADVMRMTTAELQRINGIGKASTKEIIAAIEAFITKAETEGETHA